MTIGTAPAGRHRGGRRRGRRVRPVVMAGLVTASATAFAITLPAAAQADPPVRTGWWNAVSGGGQAAPSPTTPAGGLHLAVVPGQVLAFGAVLYALPADSSATLELKVSNLTATPEINPSAQTTNPAATVQACPTKDTSWKAGDDQPMDAAPAYDCSLHAFTGSLSADGSTLTFLLDGGFETTPGQLSLALVPVQTNAVPGVGTATPVDTTQPFVLDLAKPAVGSLTLTGSLPGVTGGLGGVTPAHGGESTGSGTGAATGSTGAAGAGAGTPGAGSGSGVPIDLPSGGTTTAPTGDEAAPPVVAGSGAAAAPAAAPVAAIRPATDDRAHNAALAMLVLLGLFMAATRSPQLQRAPRLLGGAARRGAVPAAGAGAAAVAAPATPVGPVETRGLGRFAKPRTGPPRPLI